MIRFDWSLRGAVQSAATLLLKNKHYFTSSFIFPSSGDVSVTAIAAPITKRRTHPHACCCPQPHASLLSRSKMPLPPPMPQSLLFGYGNPSSGCISLLPQLPAAVLSLSLLPAKACFYCSAPINGWLLHPSLLHCPLPAPLFAAPIIDNFVAGHQAVLFLICAILFLIVPFPPSKVVHLFAPTQWKWAALACLPSFSCFFSNNANQQVLQFFHLCLHLCGCLYQNLLLAHATIFHQSVAEVERRRDEGGVA